MDVDFLFALAPIFFQYRWVICYNRRIVGEFNFSENNNLGERANPPQIQGVGYIANAFFY